MGNKTNLQIQIDSRLKNAVDQVLDEDTFGEKSIQDIVRDYLLAVAKRQTSPLILAEPRLSARKDREYAMILAEMKAEYEASPKKRKISSSKQLLAALDEDGDTLQ